MSVNTFKELQRQIDQDWPIVRALALTPAAFVVTGILVWGMERLIFVQPMEMDEPPIYVVPNPIWEEPPKITIRREAPEKPPEAQEVPEVPKMEFVPDSTDPGPGIAGPNIKSTKPPGVTSFSPDAPIATMLMQPEYPVRAANRGIEGFVDVQFDVAPSGATQNVSVIHAEPERIFNRAAMRAVKKWKFQPAEKNGKAILYTGMVQRITFEMSRSG